MKSGSDINIEEVIERVSKDPYSEGVVHGGLHPSSIMHIVNDLFWSGHRNFNKVTLEITKEQDDHHISVRVVERDGMG
tara:strand:- start:1011 stop:1244 length:234 start_codon:yes stop_codon:yes gene_type:complete